VVETKRIAFNIAVDIRMTVECAFKHELDFQNC